MDEEKRFFRSKATSHFRDQIFAFVEIFVSSEWRRPELIRRCFLADNNIKTKQTIATRDA